MEIEILHELLSAYQTNRKQLEKEIKSYDLIISLIENNLRERTENDTAIKIK